MHPSRQRHTHFEVSEDAETLKNVASDSEATAFASMVFPFPGGPNKSKPENKGNVIYETTFLAVSLLQVKM